jgi:hypothetical protein
MPISFSLSAFSDSRWYEYVVRVVLGGFATVVTGILSALYGESIGGLFLALPAIFCASATLIERHEIRRKREAGLDGTRRGQTAAALDAAGAALGSMAMISFAVALLILAQLGPPHSLAQARSGSWWLLAHGT